MKLAILISTILLTGCATMDQTSLQKELDIVRIRNTQLQNTINSRSIPDITSRGTHPNNAKPGECYAKVLIPAIYKTEISTVLKSAASYKINVIPATYDYVNEKVLVKEASEIAELIPAKYEWKTETILVTEAYDKLRTIPTTYELKSEQIMVSPAKHIWKKGHGPLEKIDNLTGEIMCRVEVPAVYKIITSKVVKTEARTESITIPAVYKTIKKRVMIEGPSIIKKPVPANYKSIRVKKVLTPASENRTEIPAVYQKISNKILVQAQNLEWRSILCETNTGPHVISKIQQALQNNGYNSLMVDGVIGIDTMDAIKGYQKSHDLAVGQITIETLKSLEVSP
jgi:hypothetical protein